MSVGLSPAPGHFFPRIRRGANVLTGPTGFVAATPGQRGCQRPRQDRYFSLVLHTKRGMFHVDPPPRCHPPRPRHPRRYPLVVAAATAAAEPAASQNPVRMGCGKMTFDTVPGWGLGEDGKSQIGSTHGGVAVGKDGTIWTSSSLGIFGFSPDGKVVRRFLGDAYSNIHDLKIYPEGEGEYLYGAQRRRRGDQDSPRHRGGRSQARHPQGIWAQSRQVGADGDHRHP